VTVKIGDASKIVWQPKGASAPYVYARITGLSLDAKQAVFTDCQNNVRRDHGDEVAETVEFAR